LFNIEERKAIASRLLDKEIVDRLFEHARNRIIEQQGQSKYAAEQVKGDRLVESLVRQKMNYLNDIIFLLI
jgi:UDP-N-acetylglucosamine transferase subunit ALG13